MEFFKRINEYYDFDDFMHGVSQTISKYSGDTFPILIEISEKVTIEENFPFHPIPDFVKITPAGSAEYNHYTYWEMTFEYYWTYSASQANQYLVKKLKKGLSKTDPEIWAEKIPISGFRSKNNLMYLNHDRYKNRVFFHTKPGYIYDILDKYLTRTVDAPRRKEWAHDLNWLDIKALGKKFETINIGFNKHLINFF